jgi:hypothetical protein
MLGMLEQLLADFVRQWAALRAHEARVAAEEGGVFKSKTQNHTYDNEEVRSCHSSPCCSTVRA